MASPLSVYHHTGLASTGGATRVAQLLINGLSRREIETSLSFELAEGADAAAILPEDFGRYLPKAALPHIHCTGNWPALLGSLPPRRRTVITLHDCELLTGGCPYPLDCTHFNDACADPCPRKFPNSAEVRRRKSAQLNRITPVLVAPSRWLARLAKAHLGLPVTVIPNGIPWPTRPPNKAVARKRLGISPQARVVLFAAHGGMDAAYKSGKSWHTIWTALKRRIPSALGFAVGGQTAGREGDLVIWPYVKRDQLAQLMAAADVLLYPTKADNHSLVVLEAMAQALPVVAFNVGGIPEQVANGQTGVLVEPEQFDAFVNDAVMLTAHLTRCRDMGLDAFFAGRKRFKAKRMIEDYLKIYHRPHAGC